MSQSSVTTVKKATDLKAPKYGRRVLSDEQRQNLGPSLLKYGQLQRIITRKDTDEVIVGDGRRQVASELGLEVEVEERDVTELEALGLRLSEELSSNELPILTRAEMVRTYFLLVNGLPEDHRGSLRREDIHYTTQQIAEDLGVSENHLTYLFSFATMPDGLKEFVRSGQLSANEARILDGISLSGPGKVRLAQKIVVGAMPTTVAAFAHVRRMSYELRETFLADENMTLDMALAESSDEAANLPVRRPRRLGYRPQPIPILAQSELVTLIVERTQQDYQYVWEPALDTLSVAPLTVEQRAALTTVCRKIAGRLLLKATDLEKSLSGDDSHGSV